MSERLQNLAKWAPPHCPNAECRFHTGARSEWRVKRSGYYRRQVAPRRIQRFTCLDCGRSFSTQTFSGTYWQKRPDLDRRIFMRTLGCMSNRQIARDVGIAPETVARHLGRMGRHCLLFHTERCHSAAPVGEIVVDGFESFEWSQYYPFHHLIAVEKSSNFFIYFNDIELRRKGSMTSAQRRRRDQLERKYGYPSPTANGDGMTDLLETSGLFPDLRTVHTDDHPAYRNPIRRHRPRLTHIVTSGKERRDRRNALWEVNLLDLLIRHSSANHKRETIAWSKRRQCSCERLAILLVWRNYIKGVSEKVKSSPTPAMLRGLLQQPLRFAEIFRARLFPARVDLPQRWSEYYSKRIMTRALSKNRQHALKYAF